MENMPKAKLNLKYLTATEKVQMFWVNMQNVAFNKIIECKMKLLSGFFEINEIKNE